MGVRGVLSRWRADRCGGTAIEFALVMPVFIAMSVGLIWAGLYFFNSNRVDEAARQAALSAMLMDDPTTAGIEDSVREAFEPLDIDGLDYGVAFETRSDGGREAVISAELQIAEPTSFLSVKGFTHRVALRVPLRE